LDSSILLGLTTIPLPRSLSQVFPTRSPLPKFHFSHEHGLKKFNNRPPLAASAIHTDDLTLTFDCTDGVKGPTHFMLVFTVHGPFYMWNPFPLPSAQSKVLSTRHLQFCCHLLLFCLLEPCRSKSGYSCTSSYGRSHLFDV
jgi:hypothetical protein